MENMESQEVINNNLHNKISIDRDVKGGWGVMGDDIVAGIAAGIATAGTYELLKMFVL